MTYQFTLITLSDMAPLLWFIGGMVAAAAAYIHWEGKL